MLDIITGIATIAALYIGIKITIKLIETVENKPQTIIEYTISALQKAIKFYREN